ncbi:MAG: hypothetical protein J6Y71_05315 [Ruminococcus sp.]|nr:hypothetical protein [Ruminococcus sp.]
MNDDLKNINKLEAEIALLPSGYISKKTIKGSIKNYYQWTEKGKKKSKYLDEDSASEMKILIEKRRKTNLLLDSALLRFVAPIIEYKHRDCLTFSPSKTTRLN